MTIGADLLGTKLGSEKVRWTGSDCILYALGIGAGQEDPSRELEYTTGTIGDRRQRVYPTFGAVAGTRLGVRGLLDMLGDSVDERMMLHGGQSYEQLRALPVAATAVVDAEITAVWDKQSATVIETRAEIADALTGEVYGRSFQTLFFRGVGGWGGERGPSIARPPGSVRDPDQVLVASTRPDQALLYRLNGDDNTIHLDPDAARKAGFDRPILHGLCTYGVVGRTLLTHYADADPERFVSLSARFSGPAFPGDTLRIETWREPDAVRFVVRRPDGDTALDGGELVLG